RRAEAIAKRGFSGPPGGVAPVTSSAPVPSPPSPQASQSRFTQAALSVSRAAVFFLAGTVIWVLLLYFPTSIAVSEVDPSWGQSLGHFLKHHFQAGQQYVFTYGPLGYFSTPMYDADLFWLKVAWELILKFLLVLAALRLTRHTLAFLPRLIFCLFVAVFLAHNPDGPYAFFLFLLAVSLVAGTEAFSPRRLVVDTFLLATIALVKTNVLVPAVAMVVIASGRLLAHRPRWRALLPPALFGTALLSWWLVLGQSVTNLPRYLYRSFEIATGYNDAMGVT